MHIREFVQSGPQKPFYAVIGSPVAHSRSPLIHNFALQHHELAGTYYALETPADAFAWVGKLMSLKHFRGLNVTIPHKSRIMESLRLIDPPAQQVGAVNTVVRERTGLTGYNTDVTGVRLALNKHALLFTGRPAVVLGSGGAARAAVAALRDFGVDEAFVVSRKPDKLNWPNRLNRVSIRAESYNRLPILLEHAGLLINTTPVGMSPDTGRSPLPVDAVHLLHKKVVMDAIYNPARTELLQQAEKAGAHATVNGLPMFIGQAAEAFKLWTGKRFPVKETSAMLQQNLQETDEV